MSENGQVLESSQALLEAQHISVHFGGFDAVQDVSFSLRKKEWLMLCGPNGAGKSTLLRALAQSVPYEGVIVLSGMDARKQRPRTLAREMGFLSQRHTGQYAFTVRQVASMGRYAHRGLFSADPGGENAVEKALRQTGLWELREHSALTLSGGEAQRLYLAQALCQEPKILLLDEPANHLDPIYQRQVFELVQDFLHSGEHGVISVVHDLSLARHYGTGALLMQSGHTYAQGKTRDALSDDNLRAVYGMDIAAWQRELAQEWH